MAELVVALDVHTRDDALRLARSLIPVTPWMKVGLELFTALGPSVVTDLKFLGASVFLDLKFHDIPNTVAGAVASAVRSGADICNIHISGGEAMCRAAAQSARQQGGKCLLLGVTVLTSTAPEEVQGDVASVVTRYALNAKNWGLDGVVCSAQEAAAVKQAAGKEFLCLCPGIRPAGDSRQDDQRRVLTPLEAVRAGADYLVVGRPITQSESPEKTARDIIASCREE